MADYPNNKTFIKGKFNAKFEGKIACWIPAQEVPGFLRLATNDRGDLNFVIAANTKQTKNTHYCYVGIKAPAVPNFQESKPAFEAPASLENAIKDEKPTGNVQF